MLKKLLFLLLCTNLCANEKLEPNKISRRTVIITGASIIGMTSAAIVAAPYVLPAATIIVIKTALATIAAKTCAAGTAIKIGAIAGAPIAGGISTTIAAGRFFKPFILPTQKEKLSWQEMTELDEARTKFSSCLLKNKSSSQNNPSKIPCECEDIALMLEMIAGQDEVEKLAEIINKRKK
jgi:hypothetical protein